MQNSLQHFNYGNQKVRTIMMDGEPWLVASDIAKILGYRDAANMTRRLNPLDKGYSKVSTLGGQQKVAVINESGLYDAAFRSEVEGAIHFRRWVTSDIIPSIQRTGSYGVQAAASAFDWTNPAFQRQMLESQLATLDRAEAAESQLAIAAPRAALADTIVATGDIYDIRKASNLLESEGIDLGRNTLFQWLRDHGWVGKNDRSPMQAAITAGYVKRKYYEDYAPTTLVTAKGLAKIHKLMLDELEQSRRAGFRELAPAKASTAIASAPKKKRRSLSAA